jgi:hypothetical protein
MLRRRGLVLVWGLIRVFGRMRRGVGRPVGAASAPDRVAPPEVKLKAV